MQGFRQKKGSAGSAHPSNIVVVYCDAVKVDLCGQTLDINFDCIAVDYYHIGWMYFSFDHLPELQPIGT